jgi:hypothetical protein
MKRWSSIVGSKALPSSCVVAILVVFTTFRFIARIATTRKAYEHERPPLFDRVASLRMGWKLCERGALSALRWVLKTETDAGWLGKIKMSKWICWACGWRNPDMFRKCDGCHKVRDGRDRDE